MFVSRILTWYVEEVQTSLQSGDWTKPDEIVEMISTYQQAKNTIAGVTVGKMETEIQYNRLDVFRQCKKGYLILGGLLLVSAFASLFKHVRWMRFVVCCLSTAILAVFFSIYMEWVCVGISRDTLHGAIRMKRWCTCLGLRFCRIVVCTPQSADFCVGYVVRRSHFVCVGTELDGSADKPACSSLKITVADVSCSCYCGCVRVLRYQLPAWISQLGDDEF